MPLILDIPAERSSLIKKLVYHEEEEVLVIFLRYGARLEYEEVRLNHFEELCKAKSIGKFYLQFIKPNFKQLNTRQMAKETPKKVNIASNETRFIKMSINLRKLNPKWFVPGENPEEALYVNVTLQLRPDGEVDKYGNLGMIVQDVPKFVYEDEKNLPKADKTKGPILGNGCEFERISREGGPGSGGERPLTDAEAEELAGDLPF